ncbi:hypothetical protein LHYA1_G006585 [Lachnellula hyalina]|uniref:QCR10 domain-containing protein n=1 Tax=Lachnellula hyalina TaxID=1316788 RepID=A0A8H8TYZ6_9HELO|nr:uncharacterized protein LHYA1_G006585 [Lachnellula hyalina]TVY25372.1 hypothetical protein LHYA1_G006585 [Lachnellula hyalina]
MSGEYHSSTGISPVTGPRSYSSYKSPYGPKYKFQPNVMGFTIKSAAKLGVTLGAFGGVAGVFALFFFSDIPRVRHDIMIKLPVIGDHFVREIPASDNVRTWVYFGFEL